jgi:hypothetical protein
MKVKLFLFLIFSILVGGTVFYFGWTQFQLEENTYGVIFTKTTGYEDEVVKPGRFNWHWEALIPTNMALHKIAIVSRSVELQKSASLPSGEVYSRSIDAPANFEYLLKISLTYSLRPEELPRLVKEESLTSETLDDYYLEIEQRINSGISAYIENRISRNEDVSAGDFKTAAFEEALVEKIQSELPYVAIRSAAITELKVPDIELYKAARAYYFDLLETRQETETATLEREREWVVSQESKLAVLRKYGELFTEYPGLIQYMALGKNEQIENLLPQIDLGEATAPEPE